MTENDAPIAKGDKVWFSSPNEFWTNFAIERGEDGKWATAEKVEMSGGEPWVYMRWDGQFHAAAASELVKQSSDL